VVVNSRGVGGGNSSSDIDRIKIDSRNRFTHGGKTNSNYIGSSTHTQHNTSHGGITQNVSAKLKKTVQLFKQYVTDALETF